MKLECCDKCITVVSRTQDMGSATLKAIDHPWVWHVICERKIIAGGSSVCSSIAEEEARRASILYHGVKIKDPK